MTNINFVSSICIHRSIILIFIEKKYTLKFMTNISFVPSICIHRSIILIFIDKKKFACRFFFHGKYIFSAILDFHFRENPHLRDKFQALILESFTLPKAFIWAWQPELLKSHTFMHSVPNITIMLQPSRIWSTEWPNQNLLADFRLFRWVPSPPSNHLHSLEISTLHHFMLSFYPSL